ncbi:hypothetical protein MA16_Dca025383 [Dendrobium catenatum]|uniref:Uncharacterized protein n=1 Tax=Dendrobium catenatum TaxID=906689 RepID=A0A2I0VHK5_9ASPA|nr:hypothetical protein MA16_Dca025383 [Dendrobium catenatum]
MDVAFHIVCDDDFECLLDDRYFDGITNFVEKLMAGGMLHPRFKVPSCYFREFLDIDSHKESEGARATNK